VASGATFLVGKDLEMSNSGLDSLEGVEHLLLRQQVPAIMDLEMPDFGLEISKVSTCCHGSRCQKTTSLTVHPVPCLCNI
jgi:hypothetical protein